MDEYDKRWLFNKAGEGGHVKMANLVFILFRRQYGH